MAASLRQTCGGGAKGAYPRCAPSCPLQPGSVEDQDYSMVHSKASTRGGPAQTRRCTDGMDRGCSAMHGMDADAPLSESPRGWAGRIERRWRLRRHDRQSHRQARDRNSHSPCRVMLSRPDDQKSTRCCLRLHRHRQQSIRCCAPVGTASGVHLTGRAFDGLPLAQAPAAACALSSPYPPACRARPGNKHIPLPLAGEERDLASRRRTWSQR